MVRVEEKVTLERAHKFVEEDNFAFAFWTVDGNYLDEEPPVAGKDVKTCVFLSESIFILELSVEIKGFTVMASRADFLDIWHIVKKKYPKLFEPEVKGHVMLIP